jgi:4-hydroxythreonine-4-phosphate dehydrogenase
MDYLCAKILTHRSIFMEKIKIGITIGDINGIGLEVILKTICDKRILTRCTPIIYGSSKVVSYHKNIVQLDFQFHPIRSADQAEDDKINVVNCSTENVNIPNLAENMRKSPSNKRFRS